VNCKAHRVSMVAIWTRMTRAHVRGMTGSSFAGHVLCDARLVRTVHRSLLTTAFRPSAVHPRAEM
jgi:hypothetical protein